MTELNNNNPRITIGIPVYYGEIYLKETLESILKQDYKDYEIIMTDNNPGGEVERIASEYAHRYSNISYIKHETNIGALQNWNSLIKNARGEYFIFAGAHDLWSEQFLAHLVTCLDENKEAVLAYAPSYWMDENGKLLGKHTDFIDTSGKNVVSRFNLIMWSGQDALYGLCRLSAIKKTRLQLEIIGSGAVWLGELSILGEFIVHPEAKRYRRINRKEKGREERLDRYHNTLFSKKRVRIAPYWRIPWCYLTSVFIGEVSFLSRIRLLLSALTNSILKYGHDMILDILSLSRRLIKKVL